MGHPALWRTKFVEGEGHVAGAAAEVEDDCLGAGEDGTDGAGGAPPPDTIYPCRQQVVQEVVARSDGVEHLLDVRGGSDGVGDAGGARAGGGVGFGKDGHLSIFFFLSVVQ